MSSVASVDLLTLPIDLKQVNEGEYLSDVSPRHKPWDVHRGEADDVTEVYGGSPIRRHHRYAERVENCAQVLGFAHDPLATKKNKLKLTNAWFCRVRVGKGAYNIVEPQAYKVEQKELNHLNDQGIREPQTP